MSLHSRSHDTDSPNPLTDLLALSHCVRWSIVPTTRPQTVADHTFRVMVIASELATRLGLGEMLVGSILHWALIHDGEESRTGDLQSSFKRMMVEHISDEDLSALHRQACGWHVDAMVEIGRNFWGQVIFQVVKLADRIEMTSWLAKYGDGPHAEHVHGKMAAKIKDACYTLADVLMSYRQVDWEAIGATPRWDAAGASVYDVANVIGDAIVRESGRRTDPK